MSFPRLPRPWIFALSLLLVTAALLSAQGTYRDMPLLGSGLAHVPEPEDGDVPGEFSFVRLAYSDPYGAAAVGQRPWMIDSPAAERHFLQGLRRLSNVDCRSMEVYLRAEDEELFNYPWLYVVEPGHWDLSDEEAGRIREYLLRGGFMIFDDFHGTYEWARFLQGIRKIFPDRPVVDVDPSSEIFHTVYDLEPREQIPGAQVLYTGRSYEKDGRTPHWRGLYDDDGRLMALINFNMDLGDAWEHADWPEYAERYTAMAYRLGINYIVYSMTH